MTSPGPAAPPLVTYEATNPVLLMAAYAPPAGYVAPSPQS